MPLDLQYDLANSTPADASPVEANFNRTQTYVNTELIDRSGTTAMIAQLQLVGNPVNALDAAPKSYVDTFIPIGAILMFGGVAAPSGGKWALANGAELESAAYPDLFAVCGNRFVTGTPVAGRFNLPNLSARMPLGAGTDVVGAQGGSRDMPIVNHTHPIDHGHPAGTTDNQNSFHYHDGVDHLHGVSITSSTESVFHQHMMQGAFYHQTPNPGFYLSTEPPNSFLPADILDLGGYGTGNQLQLHTHAINGATGAADRSLNTSQERGWHQHVFTPATHSGASGNPAGGVAVANANLPPYLVISFIIRVS